MPFCSSCGVQNPDGFRFCGSCGSPLAEPVAAAPEERKTVTVLFADLVGFTSRADRADPEDVRRLIEPFYARLRYEVEKLGGTVEKFIGDAIMALFGVPVAHEDDPERAVRAALAIREAIADLADADDGPRLSVRIGVNTGEALVRPDVSPDRGERIVADFVNVASRLESAAPVDGILVGEQTYLRTARAIDYEAFDPVKAKGKAEPVAAWLAVRARARVGADPRERGRAPLVGRLDEVQMLCDAFARARREQAAQLVTIIGPPGIGKSRLVVELSSVVEDDPELVYWRRGVCPPYGEGATFWPLAEMVKAQAGILDTDSADEVERKLHREVDEVVVDEDEARWVEAHLRPLVGVARPEGAQDDQSDDFAAWRRFFEALGESGPLVLVFEDLHWADDGLLGFIDHLVDWVVSVPLLVLCTARPELLERRSDWGGGKSSSTTISLSPLADAETRTLFAELLEFALPPDVEAAVVSRAGGNPLYAEEFVRMLGEGNIERVEDLRMPESIQGIIAARLDTLDPGEKAALQDAAILGKGFWLGAVSHLGALPRGTLDELLRSLERKQFVRRERRSSVAREVEFSFRHLLVRDVVYDRIPRSARADKHELAAEWVRQLGRPEDHAETFAYHYLQALDSTRASGRDTTALSGRARSALVEAGDRAAALGNHRAAARFYTEALALCESEDPEVAALRFRQGRALYNCDESGAEALTEAAAGLLEAGDRETAAEAELLLGRLAFREGRGEASGEHYMRAQSLLEGAPPSPAKAWVLATLGRSLTLVGESQTAVAVARGALEMAERLGLDELLAHALMTIGDARVELGDLRGFEDYERAIQLADEVSSPEAINGRINLADQSMDLGDLDRAIELRAEAQQASERLGDARNLRWLRAERAGELYWKGQWDEALEIAGEFIGEAEAGNRHYQESYARITRGRILLARHETAAALEDAARALELGREAGDPQALYPALAFGALARLTAGERKAAEELADALLERIAGARTSPVAYLWLHDLAVVLSELGRGAELASATAAFRKPTPWLDAARLIAKGDAAGAAAIYGKIGARPDEAHARVLSAHALLAAGRRGDAESELGAAQRFYSSVDAFGSVERGAELLAEPT
jgi:class 3 adenylate cyclase/tetratricopeptide (TPR) repeat protein